jgi:ABC-2 type transport system permease protein
MNTHSKTIKTMYQLLKADLFKFFRYTFLSDIINKTFYVVCTVLIATYIWPHLGMMNAFGVFFATGTIVSCIFWDCWGISVQFISDIEGTNVTQYYLSLPILKQWFFVKQMIYYAIRSLIPALYIVLLIKIVLWNVLDFSQVKMIPFMVAMISASFFGAGLSIFMTSMVKSMKSIDNISIRFLFPIWFFGGSQFTWQTLKSINTVIAYASLGNPLLYAMESIRVVFLGQAGYLPFWPSIGILWLFNIAIGTYGSYRLIKRLDCV